MGIIQTKKMTVTMKVGGKKRPVKKEVLVCARTGKIVKFLDSAKKAI